MEFDNIGSLVIIMIPYLCPIDTTIPIWFFGVTGKSTRGIEQSFASPFVIIILPMLFIFGIIISSHKLLNALFPANTSPFWNIFTTLWAIILLCSAGSVNLRYYFFIMLVNKQLKPFFYMV
jgi:hypothetical protein